MAIYGKQKAIATNPAKANRTVNFSVEGRSTRGFSNNYIKARLKSAISNGNIWPAFQPIVSIDSGHLAGFEILARWTASGGRNIPPDHFIPLLEKHNLIDDLTKALIRSSCAQARDWPGTFFIAFNISPCQLLHEEMPDWLMAEEVRAGFPLNRLQIEVTEGSLHSQEETAYATLRKLDSLGVKVSIDDFGTGYSSLARLEAFPFRKLKIDARFVRGLDRDAGKRRIAAAIIGLGQSLGITVVAEGVESEKEASILSDLGCPLGQGWLFGAGVPAHEAREMVDGLGTPHTDTPPLLDASPFQQLHQLRSLYQQSPAGLCFLDVNLRHVRVNDLFAKMLGASSFQITGKTIDEVLSDPTLDQLREILNAALKNDHTPTQEVVIAERDYQVFVQKVVDVGGDVIGLSLVTVDVTEQKHIIRKLHLSDAHFRHLAEVSPTIAWAARPDGTVDYISPLATDMEGEAMQKRIDRWYSKMHTDDLARVRAEWLAWLPSVRPFSTTFRMAQTGGNYLLMRSRAHPQLDENGAVIRWNGMISPLIVDEGA